MNQKFHTQENKELLFYESNMLLGIIIFFLYVSLNSRRSNERTEMNICERDNQLRPYEFLYYFHMSDRKTNNNIHYTRLAC